PTHYEPFSNVVLEALSFKNVVFTTAQNGASEILEDKFVLQSPSGESALEVIDEILTNHKLLASLQEKAYELSLNFSFEKNAALTLEVIKDALK
uniref:glycosyltransferase n=1 Tax=Campylobacter concisus TaxID=199 RepID=UPI00112FBB3F